MENFESPVVGISTATYFERMTTVQAIRNMADNGVFSVEVFLNSYSEYEPAFIEPVRRTILETNAKVINIHPMSTQFEPQLCSPQTTQYKDSHAMFEKVCQAGKALNAEQYVMHGLIDVNNLTRLFPTERFIGVLDGLIDLAQKYDIRLTLENVSWCILNCPEIGERFVSSFHDKLHYTLDVKQCFRSGYTPDDYLSVLGRHITNVHLCDFEIDTNGKYRWKLPGEGIFDFENFFTKLRNLDYKGPLIIEAYSNSYKDISEIFKSYQYINSLKNKVFQKTEDIT